MGVPVLVLPVLVRTQYEYVLYPPYIHTVLVQSYRIALLSTQYEYAVQYSYSVLSTGTVLMAVLSTVTSTVKL